MGFEKFGVVSHMKESRAEDFVMHLEEGKVMATKCKKCESIYFPPQVDCPKCLISDVSWVEIKGEGELITYSVVNYGPEGFEDEAPYIVGVARFGGIKIFAGIGRNIKEKDVKVGMTVKVVPVRLANGKISYEFQAIA
jgi:uncharacterized OB-fold protein